MKSYVLEFFHVGFCHKTGQGQSNVIIWIILLVLGTRCYMRSLTVIGQLVLEKKFYRFLPYMGVVDILIMWPGQFKQIFLSEGYIWNMAATGLLAFEGMFEIVNLW